MKQFSAIALALAFSTAAFASEADALAISQNIIARHMPHDQIVDPIFERPDNENIVAYTRCGDAAIWTGHYLAAESFRYRVTKSPDALNNMRRALAGIRYLSEVTGTGLLARCTFPVDSPWATSFSQEEQHNGVYTGTVDGKPYFWVGNTSRDQYIGVFFGLSAAYDAADDEALRSAISYFATNLLNFLLDKDWLVRMPNGSISTTFVGRADQQLSLLQIGRKLNPRRFDSVYDWNAWLKVSAVGVPIAVETLEPHDSYFKFNLDVATFYSLITGGGSGFLVGRYRDAYDVLRRTLDDHGNAHFNVIDYAINGPNQARDEETRFLLNEWLRRPRRDFPIDNRGKYAACGENRACQPLPVVDRITTDFLWQRSPFQLYIESHGFIEGPGIDYILPYWMGRFYGVITDAGEPGNLPSEYNPRSPVGPDSRISPSPGRSR